MYTCYRDYFRMNAIRNLLLLGILCIICTTRAIAADKLSSEEVFTHSAPATFQIVAKPEVGDDISFGTGFAVVISGKPWIITSRHVVEAAAEVSVWQDGKLIQNWTKWYENKDHDIALLTAWSDIPHIPINKDLPKPGSRAYVVGHPLTAEISINEGIISAVTKEVIRFSTPTAPGASGSPLINQEGQVMGIVTAINKEGQNFNYAQPISDIQGANWEKAPLNHVETWQRSNLAGISFEIPFPPLSLEEISTTLADGVEQQKIYKSDALRYSTVFISYFKYRSMSQTALDELISSSKEAGNTVSKITVDGVDGIRLTKPGDKANSRAATEGAMFLDGEELWMINVINPNSRKKFDLTRFVESIRLDSK